MSPCEILSSKKFPSKSVFVPIVVPLTKTVAPGMGKSDSESRTIPEICCEYPILTTNKKEIK
jgi:hypothetical protein